MRKPLFLVAVLLLCRPAALLAQTPAPSPGDLPEDVAGRMSRLEAETQALRAEVQRLNDNLVRLPAVEATPTGTATPAANSAALPQQDAGQGDSYTLDELRGEMKKYAWRKGDFGIVPYGILWGNSVYSTQRTSPGSYTMFVQSASVQDEGEFLIDGRNTRLGTDISGPQIDWFGGMQTGGKIEVDFQNSVLSTENKATILLRHAYVETKNDEYRLLIGQTWDVISPLNPGMLLYSIGWDAGNIGYRRAQIRGDRFLAFSDTSLVTLQTSINQQVFEDSSSNNKGEPSNWPIVEGRVGWTIGQRGKDCRPIIVGVSGHIGEEEFDIVGDRQNNRRRTWSGNVDLRVPITQRLGVQGECFVGENLGAFLGGIGQGIDLTTLDPIRSAGGWFEVWYDWTPRFHSHVGYSVDNPDNNDVVTAGEKTYNQFYYGNLVYDLTPNCLMGIEVSSWKTLYVDELPGDSVRSEFVVKYSF